MAHPCTCARSQLVDELQGQLKSQAEFALRARAQLESASQHGAKVHAELMELIVETTRERDALRAQVVASESVAASPPGSPSGGGGGGASGDSATEQQPALSANATGTAAAATAVAMRARASEANARANAAERQLKDAQGQLKEARAAQQKFEARVKALEEEARQREERVEANAALAGRLSGDLEKLKADAARLSKEKVSLEARVAALSVAPQKVADTPMLAYIVVALFAALMWLWLQAAGRGDAKKR